MNKLSHKLDDFFGVKKSGSKVNIEICAGIATFLAMAYILVVNPNNILWGGTSDIRWASVFIATALGAVIGTLLMAFLSKMPLAQASGMGLNATVGGVIGGSLGFTFSYGNAMMLVFISGLIFLFLSLVPSRKKVDGKRVSLRELIFDGMPECIRKSIPVGIGLFIAFIGLQNAGLVGTNQFTIIQLVDFNNPENWVLGGICCKAVVALFGLIVIGILSHFKVKGSVVIGIISATILAIPLKVADVSILTGKVDGITWAFWENFANFFSMNPDKGGIFFSLFTDGVNMPANSLMTCVMLIITFAMIDMFDTMGTVVGCCSNANLLDKKGKPLNYDKIMYSDSIATCTGAMLGTSTVTTFVESGAGIAEGGKTGLTALVTAILFFLAIFLLPIFAFIPSAAAASALIYVGVLMMKGVVDINFKDVKYSIPSFLTIIMMPLAYSITKGIGMGVIAFVLINFITYVIEAFKYMNNEECDKPKWEISSVLFIVFILFMIYFLVPIVM